MLIWSLSCTAQVTRQMSVLQAEIIMANLVTTQTWLQVFAEIIHVTIHEDINAPSFL